MLQLTHGAVGGEVGLDGSCVILRDALVVACWDPKRWPSKRPQAEVDHRPATEERKQEQSQCEEETPRLTEESASSLRSGGEGGWGLLCLDLGGEAGRGFGGSRRGGFSGPLQPGRGPFFLSWLRHGRLWNPHQWVGAYFRGQVEGGVWSEVSFQLSEQLQPGAECRPPSASGCLCILHPLLILLSKFSWFVSGCFLVNNLALFPFPASLSTLLLSHMENKTSDWAEYVYCHITYSKRFLPHVLGLGLRHV